jgi:hypothetical protein
MVSKECVLFMKHSLPWYNFLFMQSCIFYYIYINVNILSTLYLYVCRWNAKRLNIKINPIKKTLA